MIALPLILAFAFLHKGPVLVCWMFFEGLNRRLWIYDWSIRLKTFVQIASFRLPEIVGTR
jgi:hypothetical protein